MLTNADLGGRVPYFYREADMNAGFGGTFDNSGTVGNVQTLGRVISINARTRITLRDATNQNFCGSGHSTDWINFGGSGQDVGGWGIGNLDMSHWPEIATASYLFTGQYHYYEEEMMQGAYSLGGSPGTTSCIANPDPAGNHRQESKGYWPIDQERANDWAARTNLLAASNAVDGSPEKAYFTDKLLRNIAVWEGIHNIAFDMTGPAYLSTDWTYGNTQRGVNNTNAKAGPRGIWAWGIVPGYQDHTLGDFPLCGVTGPTACTQPGFANARFQSAYSGFVAGWIDDLGYCPHPSGNPCGFLTYIAPFYLNQALNPEADIHQFDDYTFPVGGGTPDTTTTPLTSWTWIGNLANYYQVCGSSQANPNYPCTAGQPIRTNVWKTNAIGGGGQCSGTLDENWPAESMAVMSFLYPLTDAASGYKGSDAYNALRLSYGVNNGCISGPVSFATSSPKWDVTPR